MSIPDYDALRAAVENEESILKRLLIRAGAFIMPRKR